MTEAVEIHVINRSTLDTLHRSLGATMEEQGSWSLPKSYGDVMAEYSAVSESGAGLIDMSSRGRLLVAGTEAIQFLNGLITNDMKTLAEHQSMPAAFPNVQGRLIASVRVTRLQDETPASPTFLIDTEAVTHQRVFETLNRFTLAGDFRVTDITNSTALISVQGAEAGEVVRSVAGDETASLALNQAAEVPYSGSAVTVIRASHLGKDGFDFVVKEDRAVELWKALLTAGAKPVGHDAFEILRIEAGVPRYGVDMDETNVVTETGLDDAVSFTKGCYIGQEIIARIKYRGHVAKRLSGLRFEGTVPAEVGATIKSVDDKEIGRITSTVNSPKLGCTIALGYLKFDYLAVGTKVKVSSADEDATAEVCELPFVGGSGKDLSAAD